MTVHLTNLILAEPATPVQRDAKGREIISPEERARREEKRRRKEERERQVQAQVRLAARGCSWAWELIVLFTLPIVHLFGLFEHFPAPFIEKQQ